MQTISNPITGQIRIALPMQGAAFCEHFGGASHFRLIDADRTTLHIISQTDLEAPEHVPGAFPAWLAQQGVQAVIVGGIGKRAVQLFIASGIPVFIAKPGLTPEDLVAQQLEGGLTEANLEACCPGHGHDHDHDHDHGHEHGSHCH